MDIAEVETRHLAQLVKSIDDKAFMTLPGECASI